MLAYRQAAGALAANRQAIADAVKRRHPEARSLGAERHLAYLEQAVAFASAPLFADYLAWTATMLTSRGVSAADLAAQLQTLLGLVRETLRPEQAALVDAIAAPALAHLSFAMPDCHAPSGSAARLFLDALRQTGPDAAGRLVSELLGSGVSLPDLYLEVFQASLHEIGRLWQLNQLTVAEEHYCAAAIQVLMAQLHPQVFARASRRPCVVIACVSGELHEIGARMVADLLQLEGFDTHFLGASMPARSLVDFVIDKRAAVLGLSATIALHLGELEATVRAARGDERASAVKIVVGGYPFRRAPDLWKNVGAHACAEDGRDALRVIKALALQPIDA